MARRALSSLVLVFIAACLVGCDHATKVAAKTVLESRGAMALVPGVLDLRYAENRGAAFSTLAASTHALVGPALLAFSVLATLFVAVWWWRRRKASPLERAGYALVLAGAVGNAVDRAANGYVVDFIHIAYWPVFNVADMAIVAGGVALAFASRGRLLVPT
jgi:signal peptidase II